MKSEAALREALTPEKLRGRLPATPRVERIIFEGGKDSTGDDAVFVWLVVADQTFPKGALRTQLEPLEEAVRDLIRGVDAEVWPYVYVRTVSEQHQLDVSPTLF